MLNSGISNIKVFACNSNPVLAQAIAEKLGLKLGDCEVEKFSDGEISVKINGYAKEEKLLIYVENGVPYVEDQQGECDIELDHLEAATFFFGLYAPKWAMVPAAARGWFPLPLYVDSADHV